MTIDLRLVSIATVMEAWPTPDLESEMADFAGMTQFAVMDFCNVYWQIPLDPNSYEACVIISSQGVFKSKMVLHEQKNAAAHF